MSQNLRSASPERRRESTAQFSAAATIAEVAVPVRATRSAPLARLCDTLDAMFEACAKFPEPSDSTFFARSMRLALAEAASNPAMLTPQQREGSTEAYRRHLLADDPHGRYAIAALVWLPGQASPVHAHHTWCGYAVLDGSLSETVFQWNGARHCASATRILARDAGAVSFVRGGRGGIHRLANCSGTPAVSLHIYGVAGTRMSTHVNDIVQADLPVLA